MPFELFFGVQQFPIYLKFKSTTSAGDKSEFMYDMLVIGYDLVRHTDGTGTVVSRHAIFKGDIIFIHLFLQRESLTIMRSIEGL